MGNKYFCIGRSHNGMIIGEGDTVAAAICQWAGEADIGLANSAFEEYEPEMFMGRRVEVTAQISVEYTATFKI